MSTKLLRPIRTALAISIVVGLVLDAGRPGLAAPVTTADSVADRSGDQLDVKSMIEQAIRLRSEKKYAAAEDIWRRLLVIGEKEFGPDHQNVAVALNSLAELLHDQAQYDIVEPLYRRSLAIWEKALGPGHPYVALGLNNLAELLSEKGEYSAAEPLYRRSLAIREKALGPDHPDVAVSLNNLAALLNSQGQFGVAESLYRRSLAIREKVLGPGHPDVAASLNNIAAVLSSQGQYGVAESLYRRSLVIWEKIFGSNHPNIALGLNNLAELLRGQGQYATAEPLYRRSLDIREKVLGPRHPDVAVSLNNIAALMHDQGRYAEAESLYQRSLGIREDALGKDHPDVAQTLNNIAGLLRDQGRYDAAESFYRRSLAIGKKIFGSNHPNFAVSLNNLALLLSDQGEYGAAEPLARQSLDIWEQVLGPAHPSVALGLNNLAELLRKQGKYSASESLHRRSLAIREKALGSHHPDVAQSLSNLAELLSNQAQYAAAERLVRRSLAIWEKALGPDHPTIAVGLNNLVKYLYHQGQYVAAEPLVRRSLAIGETALGPDHPDVALSLNNLAELLSIQGQYSAAEPLVRRSLAIREKALGPDHPDVALSLNNLAQLLSIQGQYSAAEPLVRRSLAIREKALGPDHPDVALGLNNLAIILHDEGKYAAAEALFRRSLAIREKALGLDHPDVALGLKNLALLLSGQAMHSAAINELDQALRIELAWLTHQLPLLPDKARSTQLLRLGTGWEASFGWIELYPPAAALALEARLGRQGLLAEIEQRQALLRNAPGVDRSKLDQLQVLTQQLTSISLPSDRRAAARDQRDRLRDELDRQNPDLQIKTVAPTEIARVLPADGVLVEFQRYRPFDGRKPRDLRWGTPQYIALLLKPSGSISAVPLGPAAAIEATVHKGLAASANNQSDDSDIWSQLSEQVLQPLLPHLSGSRQWFFSPDGELNRVPFAALPSPDQPGKLLAQAVQLRLITTGRELLRLQQAVPAGSTPLVMANPSFDRPGAKTVAAVPKDAASTGAQRRSANLSNSRWEPLPATELEGQQVATVLGTRPLAGAAATTTALQRQQRPRVLHVATHGFFVADQDAPPTDPLRALQDQALQLQVLRGEDPQLRSGLVLAGANQPDLDPNDDGHLTAVEALLLNLKGTELVVLSACSTGQGEVRTGEGVYGLQRALTVAGARSTLLSLWKVDDAATAEFMVRFYKRLKAGEGRADALAAVQAEFRSGAVKGPSGEDWSPPYYWAAWQLVGDWRPIQGL